MVNKMQEKYETLVTEIQLTLEGKRSKKCPYRKLHYAHRFIQKYQQVSDNLVSVAGGVARDLILEKEINDVDIFIPLYTKNPEVTAEAVMQLQSICRELRLTLELIDSCEYDAVNLRFKAENLDICFISPEYRSVEEIIHDFDMVMSQAWLEWTSKGFEIHATQLFHQLKDKQVLGYYSENIQHCNSSHVERIGEKLGEYMPLALEKPRKPSSPFESDDIPF